MKQALLLLTLLPLTGQAQAPMLSTLAPTRHAVSALRTGAINLTFSAPVTGAAALRLQRSMVGDHRAGASSGDGTTTLSLQPRQAFAPGEQVSLTVPATVRGTGTGTPAVAGSVYQFQAAAGRATGTLSQAPPVQGINSGTGVYDPTLADVNNDGNLDLLVTEGVSGRVRLYPGNGRGSFGPMTPLVVGTEPGSIVTADLNHDGKLDLVTNGFTQGHYAVAVASGNGQGGFTVSSSHRSGTALALSPGVGDVNADGHPDLVFLEHAPSAVGGPLHTSLLVRLGDGQGGFTSLPDMVLPWAGAVFRIYMELSDLNNDGRLDVLYHNPVAGRIESYLGNGQGGFALAAGPALAAAPVLLAELTGDGVLDMLAYAANTIGVYAGTGQGGFAATAVSSLATTAYSSSHAADLDGDGDLDLVVAENPPTPGGGFTRTVRVALNNGSGTFASTGASIAGASGLLTTGDVNNDGTLDVALVNTNDGAVSLLLNAPLATAPTLTAFTPGAGGTGTVVTLTGTNFAGATAVLVGGVSVPGFTVVNGTTITFTLPTGSTGGLLTVITPTGQATSASAFLVPTGTRASAADLLVQLFPNPAQSAVQLQLPAAGPVRVAFYNSLGQCARQYSSTLSSRSTTLDLRGLAPGLYTLRLEASGRRAIQQLVIE